MRLKELVEMKESVKNGSAALDFKMMNIIREEQQLTE